MIPVENKKLEIDVNFVTCNLDTFVRFFKYDLQRFNYLFYLTQVRACCLLTNMSKQNQIQLLTLAESCRLEIFLLILITIEKLPCRILFLQRPVKWTLLLCSRLQLSLLQCGIFFMDYNNCLHSSPYCCQTQNRCRRFWICFSFVCVGYDFHLEEKAYIIT